MYKPLDHYRHRPSSTFNKLYELNWIDYVDELSENTNILKVLLLFCEVLTSKVVWTLQSTSVFVSVVSSATEQIHTTFYNGTTRSDGTSCRTF